MRFKRFPSTRAGEWVYVNPEHVAAVSEVRCTEAPLDRTRMSLLGGGFGWMDTTDSLAMVVHALEQPNR